jgi:phosphoglycerate dehydrogenase-like enzyme
MNIIILDDYQDAVRKLKCSQLLEPFNAKVHTNTVKGIGQLSVRLRDADVLVLIRERTHFPRTLLEKLPRLKLIAQTGRVGSHIDVEAATRLGIAVAEGSGSPVAPAELTWALTMAATRRLPQYVGNLKHGAWQQSGLKAASMPANFGIGMVLKGKTLGVWGYGRIGRLVAGYGRAFGMQVLVWGCELSRERARLFAAPHLHLHAEGTAIAGHQLADAAVTPDAQGLAPQHHADAKVGRHGGSLQSALLPGAVLEVADVLGQTPHRGHDQGPSQLGWRHR